MLFRIIVPRDFAEFDGVHFRSFLLKAQINSKSAALTDFTTGGLFYFYNKLLETKVRL